MNKIVLWAIRWLGGISRPQWEAALSFVLNAAKKSIPSDSKRIEVLDALGKIGITGNLANWLNETAVRWAKNQGLMP